MCRLRLAAVAAVAASALSPLVPAGAATYTCQGAPAGFPNQFPQPTVFLEVQGQLFPAGVTDPGQAEHMHFGACFPQGETWNTSVAVATFPVRAVFYNVEDYRLTTIRGGMVDTGVNLQSTTAQRDELNAAMQRSANNTVVTVLQTYTLPVGSTKSNGRKESRFGFRVVDSGGGLVPEWFLSTGWQSYFDFPGKPTASPIRSSDTIICRDWITPFGYGNSNFGSPWKASAMGAARTGTWNVKAGFGSGTSRGHFRVDPDAHRVPGFPGVWSKALSGGDQTVGVPTAGLAAGWHRLVFDAIEGPDSGLHHSSVCVIPFRV